MGQYWTLLNLDKREQHNNWGKLGEFLFGGYPTILYTISAAKVENEQNLG
jgi:hypothetical protein